jgi:hypothetical protein
MAEETEPLSAEQRKLAEDLVLKDPTVREYLGGRTRTVVVERNLADRKRPADAEQVVVGVYDYEANRSVVAVVDLNAEEVVGATETPVQFQLSEEEAQTAERLAGEDARVVDFLDGRAMNPLTRLYFPPPVARGHPPHRFAIVFLRPSTSERAYAVVDLSTDEVVRLLTRDELSGP